jgi:hypothetical protein
MVAPVLKVPGNLFEPLVFSSATLIRSRFFYFFFAWFQLFFLSASALNQLKTSQN